MTTAGILLCAGFGTRLKPITDEIPKPAIPFMGHPMVWYAMHAMQLAGIRYIGANICHLPQIMTTCLNLCSVHLGLSMPILCPEHDRILGTGGGARGCMERLPAGDRFVIYHGDVVANIDLSKVIAAHKQSGADVTLVVVPRTDRSHLGMVGVDRDNRIARIRDWYLKDTSPDQLKPCCFTGIHIVNRNVLASLELDKPACLVTEIYPERLVQGHTIHAYWSEDFFADIGTPQTYLEAQHRILTSPSLLNGAIVHRCSTWPNDVQIDEPVSVSPDIALPPCHLGPNVYLGPHAQVAKNENLHDVMRYGHMSIAWQ